MLAGERYVALGSSMAAGPGILPIADLGAGRSTRNYAHQVARRLGLDLVDVTCSGATTRHLLRDSQRTPTGSRVPQLDCVTADTKLVTITIGGNDVGYIGGLTVGSALVAASRPVGLLSSSYAGRLRDAATREVTDEQWVQLERSLIDVASQARSRAPGAQVLFVDYLTVFGADAERAHGVAVTAGVIAAVRVIAARLAEVTVAAASAAGVEVIEASTASWSHGVGSSEPWVAGFGLGLPWRNPVPYHPTLAGMTAVADLVVDHVGS